MAWKPPEDDETVSTPDAPAPGSSAAWTPPAEDETVEPLMRGAAQAAARSVSTMDIPPAPPNESIRDMVMRFLTRTYAPSGYKMEDQLAMTAGRAGPARFLEEEGKRVGAAVRSAGGNILGKVFTPAEGASQFQEDLLGGARGAGKILVDAASDSLTPSAWQQALGSEALMSAAKGGALALRARMGEKTSGLPPQVSRAIRENPEFFESTKGTPEALDAANQALKNIIEDARSGHVADRTMAREFIRPIELSDVESGVRDIQKVIKDSRGKAGAAIQAEKEKLGFKSLDEQAQEIAARGLPDKVGDEDLVRSAIKALDPSRPPSAGEIEPLVKLRQAIDDRVKFGERDINPPGTRMQAILKNLRAKINERLGGPMEADLESFPMEEGVPRAPAGFGASSTEQPFGAPLRAAEQEFARVARITDPLTKKFDTVPRGVSAVKTSMQEGLRSVDPELRALEDLAGGGEALARAEGAESRFLEGERAFKQELKRFDPLTGKFETTPKGMDTVRRVMREGTEAVDPDMKTVKGLPKGEEALARMKAEVNRFDADRVDVRPESWHEAVAQIIGITPQRAARWLSQSVNAGAFPGLSKAAAALTHAASRGPQALATQHYLLQQQDPEYRAAMQALQEGGEGED